MPYVHPALPNMPIKSTGLESHSNSNRNNDGDSNSDSDGSRNSNSHEFRSIAINGEDFLNRMGIPTEAPQSKNAVKRLSASCVPTLLGTMLALGDESHLYFLGFLQPQRTERQLKKYIRTHQLAVVQGEPGSIISIREELDLYFQGKSRAFQTPVLPLGTSFQKQVWAALTTVPYGQTKSYSYQAESMGKPKAARAVANGNGANPLSIIIPCHRIINHNKGLGGYGGGVSRKAWLLRHENPVSHFPESTN